MLVTPDPNVLDFDAQIEQAKKERERQNNDQVLVEESAPDKDGGNNSNPVPDKSNGEEQLKDQREVLGFPQDDETPPP